MVEKLPVKEDDVPIIGPEKEEDIQPLKVTVDGIEGSCFIRTGWNSDKIVIQLESPHPKLGESFGTKYFTFPKEGVMQWGHDGEKVEILHLIS